MLSDLQRRLRRIINEIPEAGDVALAGGGALIVRGVVARMTSDLDYFAESAEVVDRLVPALETRLAGEGLGISRVQVVPGFARLSVSDGEDTTLVDLAWDIRMGPPDQTAEGAVLSEKELGADKLLALADRGEARDYVDVAALAGRIGFLRLYELAQQKNPKLHPGQVLYTLREFDSLPRGDFNLGDPQWQQLHAQVALWRLDLQQLAIDHEQPDPTRFPGLGW